MNRAGTLRKVKRELRRYENATAALQEIRWERKGMNEVNDKGVEIRSRVSDGPGLRQSLALAVPAMPVRLGP
jgi:hypothetical protein